MLPRWMQLPEYMFLPGARWRMLQAGQIRYLLLLERVQFEWKMRLHRGRCELRRGGWVLLRGIYVRYRREMREGGRG